MYKMYIDGQFLKVAKSSVEADEVRDKYGSRRVRTVVYSRQVPEIYYRTALICTDPTPRNRSITGDPV